MYRASKSIFVGTLQEVDYWLASDRPSCHAIDMTKVSDWGEADDGLRHFFDAQLRFIDDCLANGESVFIFCHAGRSRSATLAHLYCMGTGTPYALFHWQPSRRMQDLMWDYIEHWRNAEWREA